ncbi:saccharopine dehydrogenase family protein [Janthinobacterium sp. PSPC1-1]|uniref:saccharopine dehydrogenase family protein n=1 Tax=Janthinobacterium sp. PSPC1-1 TaxID=2804581 RepID=UPI003CF00F68
MTQTILIYGATGYTGKLVAMQARETHLSFEVAGRNGPQVTALAEQLDVPCRIFALDDPETIIASLAGVTAVLNCAGPFASTARPLMEACIACGIHYLDITAEYKVYALAEACSERAAAAGVMLLPGVGWDVVPSDCLAMYLAAKVDQPQSLRIALQVANSMSRGSTTSVGEILGVGLLVRAEGIIVAKLDAAPARFDFGAGMVDSVPLSFGDLVTAWKSTGIPNIAMFVNIKENVMPEGVAAMPEGPSLEERAANRACAVAEVTGIDGAVVRARIDTINGYSYTPLAAVEALRLLAAGQFKPGFQTPATVFGAGFAVSIADTRIVDMV